jgi:FkbM family methyltransferase
MIYNFSPTCQITGLDEIYKKYFGDKENGVFVEVGAFDGETHSNTSGLADAGWIGLYIEPVPEYADMCRERHKNNNVLVQTNMAGAEICRRPMRVAGELSTSIDNPGAMYESAGLDELYRSEDLNIFIEAEQKPLSVLIDDSTILDPINAGDPKPTFDLLVLDCEGTEWDVLREFSMDVWQPQMVIIEMHEQSPEWQAIKDIKRDTKAINDYMSLFEYTKIHSDEINTIFVRQVI